MHSIPRRARPFAVATLLLGLAPLCPGRAAAQPEMLDDSTVVEHWTLRCGLKVVTRHVPLAQSTTLTVCYPVGSDQDPPGREGIASLLAQTAFMAGAGDVPERTVQEMQGLRPLGWDVKVTREVTRLTESASEEQFPGVLRQVCQRLRGVKVTADVLRAATAAVKADLVTDYQGDIAHSLYFLAGELARGTTAEATSRFASGKGLDGLSVREVQDELRRRYVPAGAVLCIVGDLQDYDIHRILEKELGSLPAATPPTLPTRGRTSAQTSLRREGIAAPVGALGIVAPALGDTLHPSFYAYVLLLAAYCNTQWEPAAPPLTTRFQFSLSDDPGLARFYPPVTSTAQPSVVETFNSTVTDYAKGEPDPAQAERLLQAVQWLLGAPLPPAVLTQIRQDPPSLAALCSNMAAREHYGDEAFWAEYRRRVLHRIGPSDFYWNSYVMRDVQQVQLMLLPGR